MKKILLITLFVLFAGLLIAGGVYRTSARSANEERLANPQTAQAGGNPVTGNGGHGRAYDDGQQQGSQQAEGRGGQGLGNGGAPQGRNQKAESQRDDAQPNGRGGLDNEEPGKLGQNQSNRGSRGQRQGQGDQDGSGRNQQAERAGGAFENRESLAIAGTVTQAPAAGVDMILSTADGEVSIGTGPGYLQEQGFTLEIGDTVEVRGFWEDDEFKAELITRADGTAITLRDDSGRPMWSGAARGGRGKGNQGTSQAGS